MIQPEDMGFFDKLNKSKGGYIFLSHSHDDIEIIRQIRNTLEQEGVEPLCFYLKCLSDDNEIEDLIKREIDAREWFIFANSVNSRKSKWVALEREYITRTNSKKIITIDLDDIKSVSDAIYLSNIQMYRLSENPTNAEIDTMIDTIGRVFSNQR